MAKLLSPKEFISYVGLDMRESTLAESRTTGRLGFYEAPKFIVIGKKPYYKKEDVDEWVASLPAMNCTALFRNRPAANQ